MNKNRYLQRLLTNFLSFLEELQDLIEVRRLRKEKTLSFDEVLKDLKSKKYI
ncbi:MAG: hypothetical protein GY909_00705 [Oligoflexia bacterium]|nr:hypothetical protein [Oligoflexia bacterium]